MTCTERWNVTGIHNCLNAKGTPQKEPVILSGGRRPESKDPRAKRSAPKVPHWSGDCFLGEKPVMAFALRAGMLRFAQHDGVLVGDFVSASCAPSVIVGVVSASTHDDPAMHAAHADVAQHDGGFGSEFPSVLGAPYGIFNARNSPGWHGTPQNEPVILDSGLHGGLVIEQLSTTLHGTYHKGIPS